MARNTDATPAEPKKRFKRLRQIGTAFNQARQLDPAVVWWMLGAFVLILALFVVLGIVFGHPYYLPFVGLPLAVLAAGIIMVRRTERAAYGRLEGQIGGGGAALGALRRGWFHDEQPVAIEASRPGDMASAAMVFRAIGRPGVVLVVEGPPARAQKLAEKERKRVNRVVPNVPVTLVRVGTGEDAVPVRKLVSKLNRMRPALSKEEVTAVNKRLRALGSSPLPVPKGVDPLRARPDRKGMRGR
ncbi:DUF4191 domain-containing protein [Angustibacter sp. McL0619]|uniref:DUF4191 domain-containing protein n=1 Tax=Angustibacter sp. McL0619 TaxID=3415676 RepID=UPI003CF8288E